jgi:hypothetical protein
LLLFVLTKDRDGARRIKTNIELNSLIRNKNVINYIKAQRLSWFVHEHRMTNDRTVKKYKSANRYLQDSQEDQKVDGEKI